jgi:transposase
MSINSHRSRRRLRRVEAVHKPAGVIHPRVERVGAEHFGIVSVDCAKARCKWMLCDFFGNVLIRPTEVANNRPALDDTIARICQAVRTHNLGDLVVAIERTGRYHRTVQRACAAAALETRIVHPFATKQFRQASDPGNKTDDTDLRAIHRAAINGCALLEANLDDNWQNLRLLERHRRDLVRKTTALRCQAGEHLEAAFPGYVACFANMWLRDLAWPLLRDFASAAELAAAGAAGLAQHLRRAGIRFQQRTLDKVVAWAEQAALPDVAAAQHRRIALALYEDFLRKNLEIHTVERELACCLSATPYILLLSFPGINVVSAAEFAGEMGPIGHYANARSITGRAGLRPSRYQSDRVDRPNGPLVRCCNHGLRAAILGIADNLIKCNHHFNALAHRYHDAGKDPRHTRVKVAARFCRIAYAIVAGQQVFHHPAIQGRHYILDKLMAFHREHDTAAPEMLRDLQAALGQLPTKEYAAEAKPLHEQLQRVQQGRRRGPQLLGDILPIVLARLGVAEVESKASGEHDPR